jgi:hypothetical protein
MNFPVVVKPSFSTVLGGKRTFNYEPPRQPHHLIINLPRIPSLPDLVSQFLINQ